MPLTRQIEQLESIIRGLEKRIATLEAPTPEENAAEKADRLREEKAQRRARRQEERAEAAAAELARARAEAIRAIARLLPEAVKQAKAKPPRPALLRLILRATR
jgi:TolA-binding protein